MSRIEILFKKLLNGETADIKPQSRIEKGLLRCINKSGIEGLPAPESRCEAYIQALAKQMEGGGGNGSLSEISTADAMDSILANATSADVGKAYFYVGETTGAYENNAIYIIKEK